MFGFILPAIFKGGQSFVFEEADRLVEQACLEVVCSCSSPEIELLWFASDSFWDHDDDKPSSRPDWEEGVLKELYERVTTAANEELDEDEDEEDEQGEQNRIDNDDLFGARYDTYAPSGATTRRPGGE